MVQILMKVLLENLHFLNYRFFLLLNNQYIIIMKKYVFDLLFCGYSTSFIFCKKNNKPVDSKKLVNNKKIEDNTNVSTI